MTIEGFYNKAKQVNLKDLVIETMEEQREDIIALNQYQLYIHSEDSVGDKLENYKTLEYSLYKNRKNPDVGFGNPDLYDTGVFFRKMYLTVDQDSFEIDSSDKKSSDLKNKYGDKIFGLSSDSLAMYTKDYFNTLFFYKIRQNLL